MLPKLNEIARAVSTVWSHETRKPPEVLRRLYRYVTTFDETQKQISSGLNVFHSTNSVLSALLCPAERLTYIRSDWIKHNSYPTCRSSETDDFVSFQQRFKCFRHYEITRTICIFHFNQHRSSVIIFFSTGKWPLARWPFKQNIPETSARQET